GILSCVSEQGYVSFLARSVNGGWNWSFLKDGYFQFHSDPMFPDRAFFFGSDQPRPMHVVTREGVRPLSSIRLDSLSEISINPSQLFGYDGYTGFLRSADTGKTWSSSNLFPLQHNVTEVHALGPSQVGILAST